MRRGLTIVGRMYVSAPVSSNMMTTTETVMCMMPLSAAPAPRNAYVPGVMQGTSGAHAEKKRALGYASCSASTMMPTILPKEAPIAMDGTKIPAGTLQPYEMTTRNMRIMVANNRESTSDHRLDFLWCCQRVCIADYIVGSLLAKMVVVVATLTLDEKMFHALCHINAKKHVWITDHSREESQKGGFDNGVLCKIFFPKRLRPQVPFDHEGAIQSAKDADNNIKDNLEEMP